MTALGSLTDLGAVKVDVRFAPMIRIGVQSLGYWSASLHCRMRTTRFFDLSTRTSMKLRNHH
jgi:hypothetical protein